jgi:hypothetical protein
VFRERVPAAATTDPQAPRGLLKAIFGRYIRDEV